MTEARLRNYWTAQKVVSTLTWYPEIASTLSSGYADMPGSEGGATIWEPGGAIEKLVCRKADIDLAVARLKPPFAEAIRIYYMHGLGSIADVARAQGVRWPSASYNVREGVRGITTYLCRSRRQGDTALELIPELYALKKVSRKVLPVDTHSVVDETTWRTRQVYDHTTD